MTGEDCSTAREGFGGCAAARGGESGATLTREPWLNDQGSEDAVGAQLTAGGSVEKERREEGETDGIPIVAESLREHSNSTGEKLSTTTKLSKTNGGRLEVAGTLPNAGGIVRTVTRVRALRLELSGDGEAVKTDEECRASGFGFGRGLREGADRPFAASGEVGGIATRM
jgi:hypothetical protein